MGHSARRGGPRRADRAARGSASALPWPLVDFTGGLGRCDPNWAVAPRCPSRPVGRRTSERLPGPEGTWTVGGWTCGRFNPWARPTRRRRLRLCSHHRARAALTATIARNAASERSAMLRWQRSRRLLTTTPPAPSLGPSRAAFSASSRPRRGRQGRPLTRQGGRPGEVDRPRPPTRQPARAREADRVT